MNPKFFWLITAILLVYLSPAEAQQSAKIPRIGFISVSDNPKNPGVLIDSFRQGLRDLGYTEGKNILVEYRYTAVEPERVADFVTELVQLNVDVLVSSRAAANRDA